MSDTFELTEEYIYRVAPDGKSCKSAIDLVKSKAFRNVTLSNHGRQLDATCQGSMAYTVRVNLTKPDEPATACDCMSYKRPCKHALGLMFLAVRSPDEFEQDESSRRLRVSTMARADVRPEAAAPTPKPPKDTGEAILQSVLAEPEDDTPRLVYADWLDETGGPEEQARADFIRVQIELARRPNDKALLAREKALWSANKSRWLAGLPEGIRNRKNVAFHRGFFEELHLATSIWSGCADELFRAHPVFRLRPPSPLDRHKIGALVVVPHLTRIRALKLRGSILDPKNSLEILFGTPFFANVTTLDLRGMEIGAQGFGVLVASPLGGRLRTLDYAWNVVTAKMVEILTEPSYFNGLQRLVLSLECLEPRYARKLSERFGDRLVSPE
jgi:uncharacterized protein (TIGR02996 family)